MKVVLSLVFLILSCLRAVANDGYSEIGVGGLVLKNTDAISMDKEELFISADEIRVDYVFTNRTDKDLEALVAFPIPDINLMEEANGARGLFDVGSSLAFKTKIDGKAFPIALEQRAFVKERDVSDLLQKAGFSVGGTEENFEDKVRKMDPALRTELMKAGALESNITETGDVIPLDDMAIFPQWTLRTQIERKQVFAGGKSVAVSHRYKPIVGSAVEGSYNFTKEYEAEISDEGKASQKELRDLHCIDDDWVKAYRKKVVAKGGRLGTPTWIGYILKSGATWKGPISDFHLVVDKGKADNMVSFCADGVKKISATQFEVRKKDFEPDKDLNVLVMSWDE
jgi:hypothetical protein